MKIVLASHNPGKMKEMSAILAAFGVELVLQSDLGMHIEVEETGTTFRENALLKAQAVMKATRMPAISDDSGLMVDALNGAPGVYSARYGGPGLDDPGRVRLLLENTNLVVTRETILQVVWGTDISVESRTVDMHIRTLRKKLGDAGRYICTVRKVGYKLADNEEGEEE
mgnify:CR=1 FL=1